MKSVSYGGDVLDAKGNEVPVYHDPSACQTDVSLNARLHSDIPGATFLMLLSLQTGLAPLTWKIFGSAIVTAVDRVIYTEAFKIIVCLATLFASGAAKSSFAGWTWKQSLKVAAVPAIVFCFQNVLNQMAMQSLDSTTFIILNQSKLIFTALFVYLLLGKKQTKVQVFALGLLVVGASIITYTRSKPTAGANADASDRMATGLMSAIVAAALSGFAAAIVQSALQDAKRDASFYTIELALYSLPILLAGSLSSGSSDGGSKVLNQSLDAPPQKPEALVWLIPVLLQAGGGLLVGLVSKFCGSVRKGFAVVLGIIVSAIAELLIFGTKVQLSAMFGIAVVILSLYLHIKYPYEQKIAAAEGRAQIAVEKVPMKVHARRLTKLSSMEEGVGEEKLKLLEDD